MISANKRAIPKTRGLSVFPEIEAICCLKKAATTCNTLRSLLRFEITPIFGNMVRRVNCAETSRLEKVGRREERY